MGSVWELWLMVAAELVMFSLFWTATARLQKTRRFQGLYYLAGFNLLMAVALMLVGMREFLPDLLSRTAASCLELLAIAFLWHGGALLLEVPTRREPFVVFVLGSVLALLNHLFNQGHETIREAIVFLAIAWMLAKAGWCAWESLGDGDAHYRRAGRILRDLGFFTGALLAVRGVAGLWQGDALSLSSASVSTYVASLGIMLILMLANGMLVYTGLRTLLHELEHMALHDGLTGLLNHRAFREAHERQWSHWQRDGRVYALLCFDIDHFKSVNDTYGHAAGDCALQAVARQLAAAARPADSLARIGGEEFVLVLDAAGSHKALAVAERIRSSIAALPALAELEGRTLTISIGVAVVDAQSTSPASLLEQADQALYQAKAQGRNRTCLYQADAVPAG